MSKNGFGKFLTGAAIGAGLGVLFAPKKGSETRNDLKLKLDEFKGTVANMDKEEVKAMFQKKVDEIKKEMEDLDQEKVLKIAKEKSKELTKKASELVDLAKEKGTDVLQEVATEVKEKSILVTKEVLKKLESTK